ncbi:unnamed protein product [Closterium sp. Naga37s-1]|nr:unnamed protein product [Closterium sp. Naga37s-1]
MTRDGQAYAEYDLLSPSQAAASSETSVATSAGKSGGVTSGVKRGVMDITHTYVPPSRRGEGLAARLCEAACEYAKENGLYVRPTCSYVEETFMKRHPSCRDLLEPGTLRPTL